MRKFNDKSLAAERSFKIFYLLLHENTDHFVCQGYKIQIMYSHCMNELFRKHFFENSFSFSY